MPLGKPFKNHYRTLGLNTSATADEIRRAYRILARRYHPDLNPGKKEYEERFKEIAEAYATLNDQQLRAAYDAEFETMRHPHAGGGMEGSDTRERARAAYQRAAAAGAAHRAKSARERFYEAKFEQFGRAPADEEQAPRKPHRHKAPASKWQVPPIFEKAREWGSDVLRDINRLTTRSRSSEREDNSRAQPASLSVIELSVSMRDAIYGLKKAVEVAEPTGPRKISVTLPPGIRTGTVLRLKGRQNPNEEVMLIVRVAAHPFLSLHARGLVAEIPVTISEALLGASIKVPTLEEPVMVKVPPGSQSGTELRLRGKGITHRDGTRGDLFLRLMVRVPETPDAVGIKERSQDLEKYYAEPARSSLPRTLVEE